MPTTIIGLGGGAGPSFAYEPEIVSITTKEGITAFSFNVIGKYSSIKDLFQIDAPVSGIPNQPIGSFACVNRNIEHIAGGESGMYRLSVSAEGGQENQSQISETAYTYGTSDEDGILNITTGVGGQIPVTYRLEWLYPSATITTNSQNPSATKAESLAKSLVSAIPVQVIADRPANVSNGKKIELSKVIVTGSSVEKAGGLYRIRATASKGASPVYL